MSDAFDEFWRDLDEGVRSGRLRVLFWSCPNDCRGLVHWRGDGTDATCGRCGTKRSDDPRLAPIRPRRHADDESDRERDAALCKEGPDGH